jgi:cytidylate kinase
MSTRTATGSTRPLTIAIDGPAASGKSTTARLVARRLGYLHIDTGAMYRAMTLQVLRRSVDPSDAAAVGRVAAETRVTLVPADPSAHVLLNGEDVSEAIRRPDVTAAVSAVSRVPAVREVLVREQRALGREGGVVMDGRDIGTVVFPDADMKVFMVAGIEERALRRQRELRAAGIEVPLATLVHEIEARDRQDAGRDVSPLRRAPDAVDVDTSVLSIDEQVAFVVRKAEAIIGARASKA